MKSTVEDFSEQWMHFSDHAGYWADEECLEDYLSPFLSLKDLADKKVAEIGSGSGRFIKIFSKYALKVSAFEPGDGIQISKNYTSDCSNVEHVRVSAYELPKEELFDFVFCLGVLHHLAEPTLALSNIRMLLNPGGKAIVWVYGKEGNRLYLFFVKPLRMITTRISHAKLVMFSKILLWPLKLYIKISSIIPIPMHKYMNELSKCSDYNLVCNIYDQLNPTIANYWSKEEFEHLLHAAGFSTIELYHRHRYSWTAFAS
jgi:SAM-dependent methyltransferase